MKALTVLILLFAVACTNPYLAKYPPTIYEQPSWRRDPLYRNCIDTVFDVDGPPCPHWYGLTEQHDKAVLDLFRQWDATPEGRQNFVSLGAAVYDLEQSLPPWEWTTTRRHQYLLMTPSGLINIYPQSRRHLFIGDPNTFQEMR